MYIYRNIHWSIVLKFAWKNLLFFLIWNFVIYAFFHTLEHWGVNPHIPYLPLSTIGIAVAFYVSFKNNAAYDRFWEARKIWGGIINYSRTWGNQVLQFVSNHRAKEKSTSDALYAIHKRLIYRHIAYVNALRLNLRTPNLFRAKESLREKSKFFDDAPVEDHWIDEVKVFLDSNEFERIYAAKNSPTQLIKEQGNDLRKLMEENGHIEDFRHMEMMRVLEEFYTLQGKCERIKHTPFPRQYAYFSKLFTWIFILLLPFGMLGEFSKLGHNMEMLAIPFCVLISWIFMTMELVGDNSEDPFENFINDVPMTALCRTIEIDLREMLDETDLPPKITPKNGYLM